MLTAIILSLLGGILLASLGFGFLLRQKNLALSRVRRERDEIEVEERRMFDFLHGLGVELAADCSTNQMHRIIVEGCIEVVGARGGALYVWDEKSRHLVPSYCSRDCPAVIPIPERIVERARTNNQTLPSFLRLHSVGENSFLGSCLSGGDPLLVENLRLHPDFKGTANPHQNHITLMAAPLFHRDTRLGVVVVGGDASENKFSKNDFEVFSSVAEQSGFALGNALIHQEAHEKRRLEEELRNASHIQQILLPDAPPQLEDYSFAAHNRPAKLVSGDYFDYITIDEDHFGVVIGDVSGKGIAASLITAMCRSVVRSNATGNHSPAAVLAAANRLIFPDVREDMFLSAIYLVLDRKSNRVRMARAGHTPALHWQKADGSIVAHEPPGLAIGLDAGDVFSRITTDFEFEMADGDTLLLFTDGATEAIDAKGLEFGRERLEGFMKLQLAKGCGASGFVDSLQEELARFEEGGEQGDDITLIAIEKRSIDASPSESQP